MENVPPTHGLFALDQTCLIDSTTDVFFDKSTKIGSNTNTRMLLKVVFRHADPHETAVAFAAGHASPAGQEAAGMLLRVTSQLRSRNRLKPVTAS